MGSSWLRGRVLDWCLSQPGFDPSYGKLVCLATLMSSDRTKQICQWMTIYIYIYILHILVQKILNYEWNISLENRFEVVKATLHKNLLFSSNTLFRIQIIKNVVKWHMRRYENHCTQLKIRFYVWLNNDTNVVALHFFFSFWANWHKQEEKRTLYQWLP